MEAATEQSKSPPVVVVIGGPNGAGKSTCAGTVLPRQLQLCQFVNADVIAAGLSAFAPETVARQAGKIMLARLDELASARQDFAFETTLSAQTFARFLRRLKADGYQVTIVYVWVRTPELAIYRVAERVRRGGHHIPDEVVVRRYWRGLANFFEVYQALADTWVLCDNSGGEIRIIAHRTRLAAVDVLDHETYQQIRRAVGAR